MRPSATESCSSPLQFGRPENEGVIRCGDTESRITRLRSVVGVERRIRTLGTAVSPYSGLARHRPVLIRLENFLLYSSL